MFGGSYFGQVPFAGSAAPAGPVTTTRTLTVTQAQAASSQGDIAAVIAFLYGNVVPDPGFDLGAPGSAASPWTGQAGLGASSLTLNADSTWHPAGSYSGRLRATFGAGAAGSSAMLVSGRGIAAPNKVHRISAVVNARTLAASSPNLALWVAWYDSSGGAISTSAVATKSSTGVATLTGSVTAPVNAAVCVVWIRGGNCASGDSLDFSVDSVSLIAGPSGVTARCQSQALSIAAAQTGAVSATQAQTPAVSSTAARAFLTTQTQTRQLSTLHGRGPVLLTQTQTPARRAQLVLVLTVGQSATPQARAAARRTFTAGQSASARQVKSALRRVTQAATSVRGASQLARVAAVAAAQTVAVPRAASRRLGAVQNMTVVRAAAARVFAGTQAALSIISRRLGRSAVATQAAGAHRQAARATVLMLTAAQSPGVWSLRTAHATVTVDQAQAVARPTFKLVSFAQPSAAQARGLLLRRLAVRQSSSAIVVARRRVELELDAAQAQITSTRADRAVVTGAGQSQTAAVAVTLARTSRAAQPQTAWLTRRRASGVTITIAQLQAVPFIGRLLAGTISSEPVTLAGAGDERVTQLRVTLGRVTTASALVD